MKPFPLEQVSPEDMKTELICGIAKTTLRYFQDRLGREAVEEVVAETRMNMDYLQHGSNWMSLNYYCGMLDKLVERSGDPMSAYAAGLYGSKEEGMGVVKTLASSFLTPRGGFRFWVYSTSCWNKIAEWKILEMSGARGVFSVHFRHGGHTKNNCLAIQGFLASVPQLWHLPPARVRELECSCFGKAACVYEVTWHNPPFLRWSAVGGLMGGCLGLALGMAGVERLWCGIVMVLLGTSAGFNVYLFRIHRMLVSQNSEQIVALEDTLKEVAQMNETLQQKVEQRTSELARSNKRLEETLVQLKESRAKEILIERQAAIGTLAAGMAHEMNNPLHAVSVSVQGMKEDLQSNPEYEPFIANIERSIKRCRRIIGEILSFSRDSKTTQAYLPEIMHSAIDTFNSEYPASLTIDLQIQQDLPKILLDSAQIGQALFNLLMNASDAMGGAGLIQVGVEREGSSAVISVRDSGPGMTEEVKNRIFDPFFTTKQKGMGLGLSITWQLVQKNGGTIEVESQVGHGSLFRIRLPIPMEGT
jgi:signal transduction histidine kinase